MNERVHLPGEPAVAVHPESGKRRGMLAALRAEEFNRLVIAAECRLAASLHLPLRRIHPGTYLGTGQLEKVRSAVQAHAAKVVFVDAALSPVQQRNLEKAWNAKVVDRTGLILEIFAHRARTKEGALQVELASLIYQLGRLVRSWTHLERQRGGYGFLGGPGERQIELDRRMIRTRIAQIRKELAQVRRMRAVQRAGRKRKGLPTVALVGYTNAGKSTLFNRLCKASVLVADQPFATLDPTIRLIDLGGGRRIVLSDTVGFIQDLPHELVEAFHATLEAVVEADLILHVRDAASPASAEQAEVVRKTLVRIGVDGPNRPPIVEVLNKSDLAPQLRDRITDQIDQSRIALSARTGEGIEKLLDLLRRWFDRRSEIKRLRIAPGDGRTRAYCYAEGEVLEERIDAEGTIELLVRMPRPRLARIKAVDGWHRLEG